MSVNIHAINKIFEKKGINADIGIDTEDNDIIIFDSWDDYNKVRWIEKLYNQLPYGYSDEYVSCSNCGKYIDTTPGYHGDIPAYDIFNDDILCEYCIRSQYEEEYIEYCTNNFNVAIKTSIISPDRLEELGWTRLDEKYENGLHEYMNYKPEEVYKNVQNRYPGRDIIFDCLPSQFYVEFGVWIKPQESD